MVEENYPGPPQKAETLLEKIMRFTPASIALALALATVSSAGNGQKPDAEINPLSSAWLAKGVAAKKVGDLASANDALETALAVDTRNRAARTEERSVGKEGVGAVGYRGG